MNLYDFESELILKRREIFPDKISEDPWIIYHGTSSIFENDIEINGLHWKAANYDKSDVESVVRIFDFMSWSGHSGGGYPVLYPFSLKNDFSASTKKPIFLAESSLRAIWFSTRDNAGGETARAIRYALADLQEYISSEELRETHMSYLQHDFEIGAIHSPPSEINLEWLSDELKKLEGLKTRCQEAFENHKFGIVYAIKFNEGDLGMFEYSPSAGISTNSIIPPERIAAKIHIPKEYEHHHGQDDKRNNSHFDNGLVGRLYRRSP